MTTAVIMPELGESVDEATITRWLKTVGDRVDEFEPLLEVNTDKVDTEIPSPAAGTLLKILIEADSVVKAGSTLAFIGEPGAPIPGPDSTAQPSSAALGAPGSVDSGTQVVLEKQASVSSYNRKPGRDPDLGYISPVVARMSSEHQVDLARVKGTGQNSRITKRDLVTYLASRGDPLSGDPTLPAIPTGGPGEILTLEPPADPVLGSVGPGEILKLSPIRRSIAEHMAKSVRTSPHVTTVMEVDLSRVTAHRAENKPIFLQSGIRLTYTAYFVAAVVEALQRHPLVNSSWTEEGIHLQPEVNVGMAVALENDGLIVPVLKQADGLSLRGIARLVNDLADRARAGKLLPEEVRGGTFTITNHGTSGSLFATPIINQPQCGILGVGMMQKRVVVIGDAIAIRPMIYISLTFDHRILDGAAADYYLGDIKNLLENWE